MGLRGLKVCREKWGRRAPLDKMGATGAMGRTAKTVKMGAMGRRETGGSPDQEDRADHKVEWALAVRKVSRVPTAS